MIHIKSDSTHNFTRCLFVAEQASTIKNVQMKLLLLSGRSVEHFNMCTVKLMY